MPTPKQSILDLSPYINGNHSSEVFGNPLSVMKLDSNESSLAPSPLVIGRLTEFIQKSPLNWYPDIHSEKLVEALAHYTGLSMDHIQTYNGSDNALETICRTFLGPQDEVVMPGPTYDHFRVYALTCDATLRFVKGPNAFVTATHQILKAITPRTRIIYIVNPNNPTGVLYSKSQIREILKAAPRAIVVVDEAYFEFCKVTMAGLVREFDNLIVTRSFSKAFGLAGLRLGYVLTAPANIAHLDKVRIGKNINSLAQVAALAALEDTSYMERYVEEVHASGKWLAARFRELGVKIIETPANYLLAKVVNPSAMIEFLEEHHVFIRDRSSVQQMNGFVRITLAHSLLMKRFWSVIEKMPLDYLVKTARKTAQPAKGLIKVRFAPPLKHEQRKNLFSIVAAARQMVSDKF